MTSLNRPPSGPGEHKAMLRQLGLPKVDDLLVLSRNNDPYFKGSRAHWRDAEWFAGLWQHYGFSTGVHLRRVHYRAVSEGYPKPGGVPYANSELDWSYLGNAGASARMLGLVGPEAFVDRRNAPPRRFVMPREGGTPEIEHTWPDLYGEPDELANRLRWRVPELNPDVLGWDASYRLPSPAPLGYDYDPDDQPVLLEVWIEKSTMNDVLVPICGELQVNLLAGSGFQSITAVVQLLRRAEAHGKPAHVCYISDFDPAGGQMPVSVARQAQFWAERLEIDAQLTLDPIVLTGEQVERLDRLERVPVRADASGNPDRRGRKFEERNGEGVVELDALEALYPGELARIVRAAVSPYRDTGLPARLDAAHREASVRLADDWRDLTAGIRDELAGTEADVRRVLDGYSARLRSVADDLARDLAPHQARLDLLISRTAGAAGELDTELPERPGPTPPEADRRRVLYDSARHWWSQLCTFKERMRDTGSAARLAATERGRDPGG